jgi:ribosomal protein S18 acetylase RimI-like enzyme
MDNITIRDDEAPELDAFLGEQIYAFNRAATGIDDGRMLNAVLLDDAGEIVAAVSGFTWGGTCEIEYLWVTESLRGQGIGSALLRAAEREARSRGCHQIVLDTHTFQAPAFYERHGFRRLAAIPDYPSGSEKFTCVKALDGHD